MQISFQLHEECRKFFPPLFADYITRFSHLQSFFEYDPQDASAFGQRARWLDDNFRGDRTLLAVHLEQYNRGLGASERALENARALADPDTLVVVTGQQAGLFGGPLLTLYKAINAIQLAKLASHRLERPVIPIFWIASEDHDFDEVRRAFMRDRRGKRRELSIPPAPGSRLSMGEMPLPRRVQSILRELEQGLGDSLRDPQVLQRAMETAASAVSWADWFARLMADWLSGHGLVLLDPMQRDLRKLLAGFWPLVLVRGESIHREISAAATRLRRRNYLPALEVEPNHCHLFIYNNGERTALFWEQGRLTDREKKISLSPAEVTKLMQEEPWSFSPNVIIRPVVQDILLPTLALVAGPGEVAYLSQMREVYSLFGLQMPIIYPRTSFTLVPPDVAKRLMACTVGAATMLDEAAAQKALQDRLRALDAVGIEEKVSRLRKEIEKAYAEAINELANVGRAMTEIGQKNLERVMAQINYLEKKAWYHHRRRHRELINDFQYAQTALLPGGQPQERVYSVLPTLAEFGRGLIRYLLRSALVPGHQLAIITETPATDSAATSRRASL